MARFKVKNFEQFQHYKDRAPPWIKLYNDLLDNYEFACLQDASKLHLIMIWLLASRSNNDLPYDPEWVRKRINATNKVDLDALAKAGFILVDQQLQIAEQDASKPLADRKQSACLETEGERETDIAPAGATKKPDLLWEAMLAGCGINLKANHTKSERGAWNKALQDLKAVSATPDEVLRRCIVYKQKWPGIAVTPNGIAKHWSECAPVVTELRPRKMLGEE